MRGDSGKYLLRNRTTRALSVAAAKLDWRPNRLACPSSQIVDVLSFSFPPEILCVQDFGAIEPYRAVSARHGPKGGTAVSNRRGKEVSLVVDSSGQIQERR
jgi:hypothetical protein